VSSETATEIPDSNLVAEFVQISKAVAIGFAVMGFIGYFVKLIHIPM
jgi:protein translocase SEC61 complex gamma subunit